MATIKCSSCGRTIQDWDKTCLYCNAPNKNYKEKTFGSFGSSFGDSSFGSSFGDSSLGTFGDSSLNNFGSSFSDPIGSSEFANYSPSISDFGNSENKKDEDFCSSNEFSKPTKGLSSFFADSKPVEESPVQNNPVSRHTTESPKKVVYSWEEKKPAEHIPENAHVAHAPSIKHATKVDDEYHAAQYQKPIQPSVSASPRKNDSVDDYRAKLDQYRKENGYGDYARPQNSRPTPTANRSSGSVVNKSVIAASSQGNYKNYTYNKYNEPIDPPSWTSYNDDDSKNSAPGLSTGKVVAIVVAFIVLRIFLSVLFMFT